MIPFFSIIIPVYNVAPWLRECLNSVLAQTFTDWEVICVDDGSTDDSGIIIDEYVAKDNRFRVIHQSNRGVSAARNRGMKVANGAWISFLDPDDWWDSVLLEKVNDGILCHADVRMVSILPIVRFYENGDPESVCGSVNIPCGVLDSEFVLSEVLNGVCRGMGWFSCDKLFRRDLIREFNLCFLEGLGNGEDSLFAYQALCAARYILSLPGIRGYHYRIRNNSATRNPSQQSLIRQIDKAKNFYELYKTYKSTALRAILVREFSSLLWLGMGTEKRRKCVCFFCASDFIQSVVMPFLIMYGKFKLRILCGVLLLVPLPIQRYILQLRK